MRCWFVNGDVYVAILQFFTTSTEKNPVKIFWASEMTGTLNRTASIKNTACKLFMKKHNSFKIVHSRGCEAIPENYSLTY